MNSVLKGHHVDDIYEALNLEDPILFALKRIGTQPPLSNGQLNFTEINRRTGKTTRICALAISSLLRGKDVLIRSGSRDMSTTTMDTIKEMLGRLDLAHLITRHVMNPYPYLVLEFNSPQVLTIACTSGHELGLTVDNVYSDEIQYRHDRLERYTSPDSIFLRRNNR